jgi:putative FmdB family regulatory protein
MPRYDYACEECAQTFEAWSTFSGFLAERPCSCGGLARVRISGGFAAVVRGLTDYTFRKDKANRGHSGMRVGRSNEAQARGHERNIQRMQKQIKEKKSVTDDGWEIVGVMPTEMHDAIARQEGDKNVVMQDPIPFLKATGTYTGRDDKK